MRGVKALVGAALLLVTSSRARALDAPAPAARAAADEAVAPTPGFAGKSVEWWIEELPHPRRHAVAVAALRWSGRDAVPALVRALEHRSDAVVVEVARLLGETDAAPTGHAARLAPLLRTGPIADRLAVATLIGRDPAASVAEADALRAVAARANPIEHDGLARALASAGEPAASRVVWAIRVLRERDRGSFDAALAALRADVATTRAHADELLPLATSRTGWARAATIEAVGLLDPADPRVVRVLLDAVRGDAPNARWAAVRGLAAASAGAPEAFVALLAAADGPDRELRRAAVRALAGATRRGPELSRRIAAALASTDADLVDAAVASLRDAGEGAADLLGVAADADVGELDAWIRRVAQRRPAAALAAIRGAGGAWASDRLVLGLADAGLPPDLAADAVATLAPVLADASRAIAVRTTALRTVVGLADRPTAPNVRTQVARAVEGFLRTARPSTPTTSGELVLVAALVAIATDRHDLGPPPGWLAPDAVAVADAAEAVLLDATADQRRRLDVLELFSLWLDHPSLADRARATLVRVSTLDAPDLARAAHDHLRRRATPAASPRRDDEGPR
ncbi:MAG: HEAT repeat domain-containing protein [Planctomycetes bacterium]|nr:HEAT repeat domain-containing protein [Planctomycetota bacterium]